MTLDIEHLRSWIGRQEHRTDQITLVPLQALSATLDREDSWSLGDEVPPCGTGCTVCHCTSSRP